MTTLAQLSSADGWRLDNFEGLAYLGSNCYPMVSDDNFILLQETLLSCFAIKNGATRRSSSASSSASMTV